MSREQNRYVPVRVLQGIRSSVVSDYEQLRKLAEGLKAASIKIVVTVGGWDLLHIGHCRYLEAAAEYGQVLIVGVDSDRVLRGTKGTGRPTIPLAERQEMLAYLKSVDFVVPIDDVRLCWGRSEKTPRVWCKPTNTRWSYGLLDAVRPDIFVAVTDSYTDAELNDIRRYCGEVVVLKRQAETSTSAITRHRIMETSAKKGGDKKR